MDKNLTQLDIKLKYNSEYAINIDKKLIYISGELDEEIGTNLRIKYDILTQWYKEIEKEEIKSITLDISSYGGNIHAITSALDFYDELLREDNILVNTKAQGVCMSAATILLAGGTGTRYATKRTKFMLHDIQVDGMTGSAQQMQLAMSNLKDEQTELFGFYAEFSNKGKKISEKKLEKESKKWIKKYTKDNSEHYLSSQEMLDLKLIDIIL